MTLRLLEQLTWNNGPDHNTLVILNDLPGLCFIASEFGRKGTRSTESSCACENRTCGGQKRVIHTHLRTIGPKDAGKARIGEIEGSGRKNGNGVAT